MMMGTRKRNRRKAESEGIKLFAWLRPMIDSIVEGMAAGWNALWH